MKTLQKILQALYDHMFLIISFFFLLVLCYVFLLPHTNTAFNNTNSIRFNQDWTYVGKDGTTSTIDLPATIESNIANGYRISKTLPNNTSLRNLSICKFEALQTVRFYIDGSLFYDSTDPTLSERHYDKTSGSYWIIKDLPADYYEKEITIEVTSPYPDYQKLCGTILLGTRSSIIFSILSMQKWNLIFSILFFVVGIALIGGTLILHKTLTLHAGLFYLGWFQFWAGLWTFAESHVAQLFTDNAVFVDSISFISLMMIIVAFLKYFSIVIYDGKSRLHQLLSTIVYITITILTILQLLSVCDFIETLPIVHTILAGCIVYAIIAIFIETFRHHKTKLYYLLVCCVILCVCGINELVQFYRSIRNNLGISFQIGLLVCMVIITYYELTQTAHNIQLGTEAKYYAKLAVTDFMTGCANRTAFQQDMLIKNRELTSGSKVTAIMCDVNGLKSINDTYGHEIGDRAICHCATILNNIFGSDGTCYRTGGDEFACILFHYDDKVLSNNLDLFIKECKRINAEEDFPFSAAIGYANYNSITDKTIENTLGRADKHMYNMKRGMKIKI